MPEQQSIRCGKVAAALYLHLKTTKTELTGILKDLGVKHRQSVDHHISRMQAAGWLKKTTPDNYEIHHSEAKRLVIDIYPGSFAEDDPEGMYLGAKTRINDAVERFGDIVKIREE
uniref:Uncharacterized protein n=1 Tax=Candidatus Methanogaster sp. ANME-2c ERB4 TaxID=2759911 RepID=A0A7G9Y0N3_9EURY|nr:hypothetical protein HEBJAHIM_00008 [Methanosarcinales archaeon ANME-2c ERB4]QNO42121.1 hypothetical protein INBEEEIC_00023 [Methanosarcinales archaeon ANME-2c ERB4]QNO42279.1 hypothetical protein CCKMDOMK_00008 [Methanosarcinales archaeon ANME-2c ERB4]QNO42487.1 hypothetical protein LBOOMNCC_00040 [Methanosarcinales archaeon ANME-2c ERB4]QNO42572.1 hypothetical protein MMDHCPHC_00008 [Methanosarcinales archaeon ANME-2c ERB4]